MRVHERSRSRPLLLHLTTTDISLELLLGPQLDAFAAAGYDVHGAAGPGPFQELLRERNITFHPLEYSTRSMSIGADMRAAREVFELFRTLRPDIVHTHNPKPGVYGRIAAKLTRVPAVVNTVHGLYAQPTDRFAKRLAVYTLERVAALCSGAELVQNVEDFETLRRLRVPDRKLILLGNGIDLNRFKPASASERSEIRASLGLCKDTIAVGAVGRLVEEKGYLELFEAFRQMRAVEPMARLVVVGQHEPGKADALDARTIAKAEAEGVLFLGHRDDVHELYAAMDMYVLASHREGFPRSAMEAVASGLPLVLTDIRGCRQVVDHESNGYLVPVRDANAITTALVQLAKDQAGRERMAAAGLAKAAQSFDQQKVIDLTLGTYQQLLKRGAEPSACTV